MGIERKRNVDELAKNLFSRDRARFEASVRRLRDEFQRPILLFEGGIAGLQRASIHNPDPHLVCDALFEILMRYNVGMLELPGTSVYQRLRCGELAARLLVRGALALEPTR